MDLYPYKFDPIYKQRIWGGRNIERLYGRTLPGVEPIGESWELADLPEGVSLVANGPAKGTSLTELTSRLGPRLLGGASPHEGGRFPLLLKLLDANDILSLQVHPDAKAARDIGGGSALKTECWYIVESRGGYIYKDIKPNVAPEQFRRAIQTDTVQQLVQRYDVGAGDFHFLPAGMVHALGAGVVVAEVQTPSDTTYRVTDWGRGRETHVERSMQCIHFTPGQDADCRAGGEALLRTDFFAVAKRSARAGVPVPLPVGRCAALMILSAQGNTSVTHDGETEPAVPVRAGDTVLVPAALRGAAIHTAGSCAWLETTLPER